MTIRKGMMMTTTAVKERPILFSGPMVRAILDGRKSQTRRIMKTPPDLFENAETIYAACPYGKAGDRIWVRETWTPDHAAFYPHFPAAYRADAGFDYERNEKGETYSPEQKAWFPFRWRPSIHMPRWASRITLEITGVRVERLCNISHEDAIAEGIEPVNPKGWKDYRGTAQKYMSPVTSFQSLWFSINGLESWQANPWVWVIEFAKV